MHREGASDNSAPFLGTASCEKLCVSLQQPSEARPALCKNWWLRPAGGGEALECKKRQMGIWKDIIPSMLRTRVITKDYLYIYW